MKTVYAVSKGAFSDYSVLAIFETKNAAAAEVKILKDAGASGVDYYDYDIEEFRFYEPDDPTPGILTWWSMRANLWDDGRQTTDRLGIGDAAGPPPTEPTEHHDPEIDSLTWPTPIERPHVRFVRAQWHQGKGGRIEIHGTDRDAVMRCYSDRLAEHKAQPFKYRKQINP